LFVIFELFQCKITIAGGVISTSKLPIDETVQLFETGDLTENFGI
jgi:hypothetical protein